MCLALILCLLAASTALGQDLRSSLFAEADELIAQGQEERADVLAPKSWGKGMEAFNSAERKLAAGKNLDDIRKDLNQAVASFQEAINATDLAMVTLATTLKARDDAAMVGAAQTAPELWAEGEGKFAEAGRKLEEGDVNDARKKGAEAETYYRDAELAAIKTSFFDETRKLLAMADREKVEKVAPITLARAASLLAEAEAVAQYLLANSNLQPSNLQAVGYGEMNPIANNETPEGRKKNRRIDIVITPAN